MQITAKTKVLNFSSTCMNAHCIAWNNMYNCRYLNSKFKYLKEGKTWERGKHNVKDGWLELKQYCSICYYYYYEMSKLVKLLSIFSVVAMRMTLFVINYIIIIIYLHHSIFLLHLLCYHHNRNTTTVNLKCCCNCCCCYFIHVCAYVSTRSTK